MKRLLVSGLGLAAATLAFAPDAAAQHVSVGVTIHAPPVLVDVAYADHGYRSGIVAVGHSRPHRHVTRVVHVHRPPRHVVVHHHPHRCSGLHEHGKHRHHKGHHR